MDTSVVVAVATVVGLVGAAAVSGAFSIITTRTTTPEAKATKRAVQGLGSEVKDALALVNRVLNESAAKDAALKAKDAEIRRLRRQLTQAKGGRGA